MKLNMNDPAKLAMTFAMSMVATVGSAAGATMW